MDKRKAPRCFPRAGGFAAVCPPCRRTDCRRVRQSFPSGLLVPFFLVAALSSCDLLRDSPYGVEAWTPGSGFHADPVHIRVSLLLSHESDKIKTEQAFSLSEDRKTLQGNFSWEGLTLVFTPASPLEPGRDYTVTLGTGAQDLSGLSLENKFEASFTTRPPGGKLRVTGSDPEYGGVFPERRGGFRLFFSEPVSLASCQDHISISPSAPGFWRLEDGGRTACFIPRDPWQPGAFYRVKVESGFSAVSGASPGEDYFTGFSAGGDNEKPVLLKALAVNRAGGEEEIPVTASGIPDSHGYYGWESSTRLRLVFSEPVDTSTLKDYLTAEPNVALVMESDPVMSGTAVFRFAGHDWGDTVLFRLGAGIKDGAGNGSTGGYVFRIHTRGPLSRPPSLTGIRFPAVRENCPAGEALRFTPAGNFADLPIRQEEYAYGEPVPVWIELYFECADDTEIDPFSVMDLFRAESTNNALAFSPLSVRASDFTLINPAEGWEKFQRLEVRGLLTNRVGSGIVTFRIPPGLRDKRGNRSTADFRISLLK